MCFWHRLSLVFGWTKRPVLPQLWRHSGLTTRAASSNQSELSSTHSNRHASPLDRDNDVPRSPAHHLRRHSPHVIRWAVTGRSLTHRIVSRCNVWASTDPTRYICKHELILASDGNHQRWIFDPFDFRVETQHSTWICILWQREKREGWYYVFILYYCFFKRKFTCFLASVGDFDLHRRSKESEHNIISRHKTFIVRKGNRATFDYSSLNNHNASTIYRKR